ncbi:uncharacterized protein N7511_006665 [Penicillium nucicola]|uniref:uncharacterized protein n=1 Tax=Penicillium nucicola TaxID=1850975 RepID=UPI0025459797|nr:uncharacterized protein N7511_006665 [Penicillium nucicola]KAJ5757971.1 hypothetical protein N7511_006665 [Penicillium nucicola]
MEEDATLNASSEDAGTVVFLFPPPGRAPWSLSRVWAACKLWVLDYLTPAHDSGVIDKRVQVLMQKHEESVKLLEENFPRQRLWYLEVVAVHPSLQSRGLGGGVMRWILDHIKEEPVYLECTRQENVMFYEGFGFKVAEVVEMFEDGSYTDGDHGFKHWVMVHPGKNAS